jgi:hypothetical protein
MYYELLLAFASVSRVSDAGHPERRRRAAFEPRAERSRRRLFRVRRTIATRLLRTGPKR